MASTLPSMMVWMSSAVGRIETMNSPSEKKPVKTTPITASWRSRVEAPSASMAAAARPPERKAPRAKGRPSM